MLKNSIMNTIRPFNQQVELTQGMCYPDTNVYLFIHMGYGFRHQDDLLFYKNINRKAYLQHGQPQ